MAIVRDPNLRTGIDQVGATEEGARALGIELLTWNAGRPEEYDAAFASAKKARAEALIALPSASFTANRERLLRLAGEHAIVAVWEHRLFAESGRLVSYGPDFVDLYRGAARYVHRILQGAKPAEWPVEQATKLELVVNLKTAKMQKVTIPPALLVRADQIIQ